MSRAAGRKQAKTAGQKARLTVQSLAQARDGNFFRVLTGREAGFNDESYVTVRQVGDKWHLDNVAFDTEAQALAWVLERCTRPLVKTEKDSQ